MALNLGRLALGALAAALCFMARADACAAPRAVSTDGEATAYMLGDFNGPFDVAYEASLDKAPRNKSWTSLSILLLGRAVPSDAVSVGLFRGSGSASDAVAFTLTTKPGTPNVFKSYRACRSACRIELRGSANTVEALLDGAVIASWPRGTLRMRSPLVQLNAEAASPGDTLSALLHPTVATSRNLRIARPACAFTTQGIEPSRAPKDDLRFRGTYRPGARVTYISLASGAAIKSCAKK